VGAVHLVRDLVITLPVLPVLRVIIVKNVRDVLRVRDALVV
tara:strand:- start:111 stop:233 length:123 start_codon:yes stop_codon:yes gene_type:complete